MSQTAFRGPNYSAASMFDGRIESDDGPSITYQCDSIPDIRYFPTNKDGLSPGRVPAFLNSPYVVLVDAIPSATGTATLAALANVTNGTAMTLVTVAPGNATAGTPSIARVPFVPFAGGAPVTVTAIDFGFTTGTITAASATVTVPDSSLFRIGEWVCVGGAGNSAKTLHLMAQVTATPTATTITLSQPSQAALTGAPIGRTNLPAGAYSLPGVVPTGVFPYQTGGMGNFFDPPETITRGVSITGVASGTGGAFTVRGYDVFGAPMSETITVGAGVNTVYGKKAFKYIVSVTPGFTDAHNYSVGVSDVIGVNLRSDRWENLSIFYNGGFAVSSTGWTQALQPPSGPATATTADVRGTVQVSSTGGGSALASPLAATTNGSIRVMIAITIPLSNDLLGTPQNQVPIFGLPQFTN